MAVRAEIQQIALAHRRRYGYRRITAERRRRGLLVNHKRVARLMREDNLLAIQPKAFVVTTDARHDFEVYLNLASRLTLTGIAFPRMARLPSSINQPAAGKPAPLEAQADSVTIMQKV
ncbi:MAG: IS3 family transposase [Nitrospirota bacterium]